MAVRRSEVVAALSVHDAQGLTAILDAAAVSLRGAQTSPELAQRITDALWWHYSTPLGYLTERASLDEIVDHVARRLGVRELPEGDAWARLRAMTVALARTTASQIALDEASGVSLDQLDDRVRQRLDGSWMPTAMPATGGAVAYSAGAVGKVFVRWSNTPIGRLLPLIPKVGPVFRGVRGAAGVAALVGTPVAVGLSVVALNNSLGSSYRKLVPLLLGIGALGPTAMTEADEL